MTSSAAQLELLIEIESDPIAGSVAVDGGVPEQFCGWIELVAAIEAARHVASGGVKETLGSLPGANVRAI